MLTPLSSHAPQREQGHLYHYHHTILFQRKAFPFCIALPMHLCGIAINLHKLFARLWHHDHNRIVALLLLFHVISSSHQTTLRIDKLLLLGTRSFYYYLLHLFGEKVVHIHNRNHTEAINQLHIYPPCIHFICRLCRRTAADVNRSLGMLCSFISRVGTSRTLDFGKEKIFAIISAVIGKHRLLLLTVCTQMAPKPTQCGQWALRRQFFSLTFIDWFVWFRSCIAIYYEIGFIFGFLRAYSQSFRFDSVLLWSVHFHLGPLA